MKKALTIGVLAERLKVPWYRVQYLVQSRNIKPVERAGHLRIFDEKAFNQLSLELSRRQNGVTCDG